MSSATSGSRAVRPILLAAFVGSIVLAAGCSRSSAVDAGSSAPVRGSGSESLNRTDPFTGNAMAAAAGRRLFVWYNCYGCHGGHGGGGMGPSLRDKVWLYGGRDDQIFDSIAQGRPKGMPAWGTRIPQDQIWQLIAYIRSMRTLSEPDPPNEPANEQVPNPENNDRLMVGTQPAH
jgi:cytochrome c oxidase cbb3-type subunit III